MKLAKMQFALVALLLSPEMASAAEFSSWAAEAMTKTYSVTKVELNGVQSFKKSLVDCGMNYNSLEGKIYFTSGPRDSYRITLPLTVAVTSSALDKDAHTRMVGLGESEEPRRLEVENILDSQEKSVRVKLTLTEKNLRLSVKTKMLDDGPENTQLLECKLREVR